MQKKQIAVIDVGSSKITALIGERGINKTFIIKARKDYAYDGYADGEFFDAAGVKRVLFSVAAFITNTVSKREIRVYVGVPGEFTKVTVKNSQISFSGKKRITETDIDALFDSAFVPASAKYSLINRSAIVYELDDYRRLANPIGATSEILKGTLSFIVCSNYFIEIVKNTLRAAGIDEVDCVSSSLAEVMYLLEPETRDRIVMLLDVGYISSTFTLVQGDGILYQRSFAYGGVRKLSENANIRLRRLYVINTFNRICNHVNGDYAYFSRANASKGLYKVLVSDKVRGLVRPGDNCEIKVLPNGIWVVADIVKTDDLETQLMRFKDLGGNY